MAAFTPFEPAIEKGQAGLTQSITIGAGSATSQTIQIPASVGNSNNALLVSSNLSNGTTPAAYIRLSVEASTAIVATATDTPLLSTLTCDYVRLFASPNPTGAYNIAVVVTVTPSIAGTIWFTPGQGGVV